jgi:hypothetical protein
MVLSRGELAEWLKAVVLKTIVAVMSPGVRIPHSPPRNPEKSGFLPFMGKADISQGTALGG